MIVTALLTVTVPAVLPPRVLRFAAVTGVPPASLTVIVIASVPAVVRAPKFDNESAARVAVTTPVVLAAIALRSVIDGLPVMATVASVTSTKVPAVTNAAVTCAELPVIATALVTVTVPVVAPPIVLKFTAVTAASSASLIVISPVKAFPELSVTV